MKKTIVILTAAGLASAAAADITVDIAGVTSNDGQGAGVNVVLTVATGVPNVEVTSIDFEGFYVPNGNSWTAEPHWTFQGGGHTWNMSDWGGVNNPNPLQYAGSEGTSFFTDGNGDVTIEFWEDFVDFPGAPDGTYDRGSITMKFVPAPSSLALLGLGGLVAIRRRR